MVQQFVMVRFATKHVVGASQADIHHWVPTQRQNPSFSAPPPPGTASEKAPTNGGGSGNDGTPI